MAAASSLVTLEVIAGPHQGARFQFDRHETFLVGRAPEARLQLIDDAHFSRHHFLLEFNPPRCFLRDLGSRNGTMVNGRKVTECYLNHGDVISGGRTRIRLSLPEAAKPPTPGETLSAPEDAAPEEMTASTQAWEIVAAGAEEKVEALSVQVAPGYELVRTLGEGGMGVVHLVRRLATGQLCALKIIQPGLATNEKAMQLFLREISVLSRLDHPHIIRFHEMGMTQGQFFFAMDYVETIDLQERLAKVATPVRIGIVAELICQVLEGLSYAHESGYVHRDIKPSNILVSEFWQQWNAKLADFGLAKNFENAGFSGMTFEGEVLGTVAFMPPEQISNARAAKPAGDIYSMGATLYQLLTRQLPFDFRRKKDHLAIILQDEPIPLAHYCLGIPEGLAALVHRALAKDPRDRFATAEAMRQALRPYAEPALNLEKNE